MSASSGCGGFTSPAALPPSPADAPTSCRRRLYLTYPDDCYMDASATDNARAFPFLRVNRRQGKPRTRGVTEMRGPYYTPIGVHQLTDIFETMGHAIDTLKFAGGSFSLMPRKALAAIIDLCHEYDVHV